MPRHVRVAIIGAGFSGLGAGVRLRQAGVADFIILERAAAVGGTWRDNTYPGRGPAPRSGSGAPRAAWT